MTVTLPRRSVRDLTASNTTTVTTTTPHCHHPYTPPLHCTARIPPHHHHNYYYHHNHHHHHRSRPTLYTGHHRTAGMTEYKSCGQKKSPKQRRNYPDILTTFLKWRLFTWEISYHWQTEESREEKQRERGRGLLVFCSLYAAAGVAGIETKYEEFTS